ncbi:MAG: hypothetical protein CM15mP51_09720 [Porticoccaceae bacterium]|nr:MAG: hypothetical protein CM15mP51_09720 [Porticoccaceae bacterium]
MAKRTIEGQDLGVLYDLIMILEVSGSDIMHHIPISLIKYQLVNSV